MSPDQPFWQMVAGLILRHGLTAAAGVLVTYGLMDKGETEQFITIGSGFAIGAVGLVWSWWQKRGQQLVKKQLLDLHAELRFWRPDSKVPTQ